PLLAKAMRRVARKVSAIAPRATSETATPVDESQPPAVVSERFPVLMYHRVSPTGAAHTRRYRVTPEMFESQLAHLREAGYASVSADELLESIELRRSLPGKRVVLTFDDAYVDFAEFAWPLLQRYGFGAFLFVVSGCTGGTNAWDRRYGEELPLLGWDALRELQAAGVTIGAHTVSHPALTGLSPREIAAEMAESRRTLQEQLGTPIETIAYPYGDQDEIVEHIAGAAGFRLGFTCRLYPLHPHDPPLSLPRVEVEGTDSLETFIAKLTV
ncbi:MAG TPA: polysaccharide deacetylase family protein, partial [Thermomicrobiales bacterium]|nr:polysaccharide deacetylase family protein [Thermomicrobiales bacterium]